MLLVAVVFEMDVVTVIIDVSTVNLVTSVNFSSVNIAREFSAVVVFIKFSLEFFSQAVAMIQNKKTHRKISILLIFDFIFINQPSMQDH